MTDLSVAGEGVVDETAVHLARPLLQVLPRSERGGYAAGLATGLLGFAQIFWDKNRQAIHDKIAETAVVRD